MRDEPLAVEGVQRDVDPVQPGGGQRRRHPGQADAVGGDRHPRARRRARPTRSTIDTRPRRSSGSPPVNRTSVTPSADGDADQPDDLVVGEQLRPAAATRGPRAACSRCSAGCTGRSARPAGRSRRGRRCPPAPAHPTSPGPTRAVTVDDGVPLPADPALARPARGRLARRRDLRRCSAAGSCTGWRRGTPATT